MSIRLDAVVSAVAMEAGLDPDRVSQDKANILQFINDTRREIYGLPVRFSALEFSGEFVSVANVTAGTVAATQNQSEVTGTSTSFVTAMAGRYMSIGGAPWQKISYVTDSTHLTLESGWNDSSTTGQSYVIWKRHYALPGKVEKVLRIIDLSEANTPLAYYEQAEFFHRYGFADTFSSPVAYTQFGSSDYGDSFLGATVYAGVTASAGSPIVDFSGAGLVTALAAGDRVIIGNATTSTAFYVDKVYTDNRIALTDLCQVSTGGTSATAISLDRMMVQFFPAISATRVFMFQAKKKLYSLNSSGDFIEDGWYSAIKKGAIAKAAGYVGSPREQQKLAEYNEELKTLIRNQYRANNPAPRLKPVIDRRYGGSYTQESDRDTR